MKLSRLTISATRLCGVPVSVLSADIGMQRSALSRALSSGEIPDKYAPLLSLAVSLEASGDKWSDRMVGHWYLSPRTKRGVSPRLADLATAVDAINRLSAIRITVQPRIVTWHDARKNAVAEAKGDETSSTVYIIRGDGKLRRLLYITPAVHTEAEALLSEKASNFKQLTLERHTTAILETLAATNAPVDLDKWVSKIRAGTRRPPRSDEPIHALREVAKFSRLPLGEVCERLGLVEDS